MDEKLRLQQQLINIQNATDRMTFTLSVAQTALIKELSLLHNTPMEQLVDSFINISLHYHMFVEDIPNIRVDD